MTLNRIKDLRLAALGLLVISVASGCGGHPSPATMRAETSRLTNCFPALLRFGLKAYRNQDWCQCIWYARGGFSNTNLPTCNLFEGPVSGFDATAAKDFKSIGKAVKTTGVGLLWVQAVEFDQGQIVSAEFQLDHRGRRKYVYKRGYLNLPADIPNELIHRRIDENWYYVWQDWN